MKRKVLILGVIGVLLCSVPSMPAKAVSDTYTQTVSTENQIRTKSL